MNHIAKIHSLPNCEWDYVTTSDNPADPSSRGLLFSAMMTYSLHWIGPLFLHLPESEWPKSVFQVIPVQNLLDTKPVLERSLLINKTSNSDKFILRFLSLTKMQRIIALMIRVCNSALNWTRFYGPFTRAELDHSLMIIIRMTQATHFSSLLNQLKTPNNAVSSPTSVQLTPFVDVQEIIRVGSRLRYSSLSYDIKHPVVLSKISKSISPLFQAVLNGTNKHQTY